MEPAGNNSLVPSHLTQDEAQFVYGVEVLGLPVRKAAELAGMSLTKINDGHIMQAREAAKRELRGVTHITKDDVVFGVRDAIDRARLLAEPATEIKGWETISKLLGYDAPSKIDVNVRETVEVIQKQVRALPDAELVRMLGAGNVIDGQFYEVKE